jgi:putative addiction module CopG family antidote
MNSVKFELPEDLRLYVLREVESGRYESELEVIEAALVQMRERSARLQEVRRKFLEEDVDQLLEAKL